MKSRRKSILDQSSLSIVKERARPWSPRPFLVFKIKSCKKIIWQTKITVLSEEWNRFRFRKSLFRKSTWRWKDKSVLATAISIAKLSKDSQAWVSSQKDPTTNLCRWRHEEGQGLSPLFEASLWIKFCHPQMIPDPCNLVLFVTVLKPGKIFLPSNARVLTSKNHTQISQCLMPSITLGQLSQSSQSPNQ